MRFRQTILPAFLACLFPVLLAAQTIPGIVPERIDPCGYSDTTSLRYRLLAEQNWGYGYDDLLNDLAVWSTNPSATLELAGTSVDGRDVPMLTITGQGREERKKRIWIHARTHPSEVEGTYVTNEMIRFLLSEDSLALRLRDSCIFNIVPMVNPDGVELKYPRENANGVDLESNWNTFPHQPEVDLLEGQFLRFMASASPIRVALNMHSAYNCRRYFVYHAPGGTSAPYAAMEREFIAAVQSHFPGGIENYDYFVSWTGSTPLQYPESWFWIRYRESVLALTYEDMNCASHGLYDRTSFALLAGIADFLGVAPTAPQDTTGRKDEPVAYDFALEQNFPNPFSDFTHVRFRVGEASVVSITLHDLLGRHVGTIAEDRYEPGYYQKIFHSGNLTPGVYFCRMRTGDRVFVRSVILQK